MKNNGIEIYVHIPFCARKCDYCDFVSFVCGADCQASYFDALKKEIMLKTETTGKEPVVSCFFGGGTPSLPDAGLITDVLLLLKERYAFENDAEISIEVNPNSASYEKLCAFKAAGFNRLSIGLQSANNEELKLLSRLHNYEEFLDTLRAARKAGFDNINVDLMSAIPGQTLDSYKESLRKVIALNPEHISAYSLILEEGTPFYARFAEDEKERDRLLPDEDTEREMYYATKQILGEHGFYRYEISNYAKKGYECRHNIGYWTRRDYIGYGIAAASLYKGKRYSKHEDLEAYIQGDYSESVEELDTVDCMEEYMILGLRLVDGISKAEFEKEFGKPIEAFFEHELLKLEKEGLLVNGDRVYLTDKGMDLANYCMSEFMR